DPVALRAEGEAVEVTGQVTAGIAGEEIHLIAQRTESEGNVPVAADVKGRLVEREVAAGRNRRAVRDAVFLRVVEVVGQVPAGEVDVGAFEIEQLDPIDGRIAVREGFVDD